METVRQVCTFRLGGQLFGLDVLNVQEVMRSQAITPVPLAHPVVRGLINLRGEVVTALDLGRRLGISEAKGVSMNVVVRYSQGVGSLLVDEVGDVLDIDQETCEEPPSTLEASMRELITKVVKLKEGLLLVLDLEKAMRLESKAA
jgi:purine-binding chemotaxis protein CheW